MLKISQDGIPFLFNSVVEFNEFLYTYIYILIYTIYKVESYETANI